jgi:hypothetical protein
MKKIKMAAMSAAAAFSVFGSAAMADTAQAAATAKTSADFKDLGSVSADLKAKIDDLLAKGIMEGVSEDTFGIGQNMTRAQFAKVLDLIYGVPVDASVAASGFADVKADDPANGWSVPYVEAAKKAGLIDGVTDTTFAPGDNVTIGQFATALLKGLGKPVDVSGSPWYAKAVQEAKRLDLIATDADGAAAATRADLAAGGYAALNAIHTLPKPTVQVSIVSAKATDAQTVQVVFDQPVDTAKAVLKLSQGTAVIETKAAWSADGKTATLTLSSGALAAGDYTVALSGLDAAAVKTGTASFRYDGPAATDGGLTIAAGAYVLPNVIDSGLTGLATGTDGFVDKSAAEDPTVSKFAKEIAITAKAADGEPVALPGVIQSIVSSNPAVAKVGVDSNHRGYVLGVKAGTATINLTYQILNGDTRQMTVPVTVKADPIAVDKLEAGNSSVTTNTYSFDAFSAMDLKVTDNYGITYEGDEIQSYNFALGVLFNVSNVQGDGSSDVGSVTVDSAGNVNIVGNVTSFELTAVSFGGKQATTYITVE